MIKTDNAEIYNEQSLLINEQTGIKPYFWQGAKLISENSDGTYSFSLWDAELLTSNEITLISEDGEQMTYPIANSASVEHFCFSWDFGGRMYTGVSRLQNGLHKIYWTYYDSITGKDELLVIDGKSAQCAIDARRFRQSPPIDMTLAYIRDSSLYVRYQRERFAVEHRVTGVPSDAVLRAVGVANNRFLFKFFDQVEVLP